MRDDVQVAKIRWKIIALLTEQQKDMGGIDAELVAQRLSR